VHCGLPGSLAIAALKVIALGFRSHLRSGDSRHLMIAALHVTLEDGPGIANSIRLKSGRGTDVVENCGFDSVCGLLRAAGTN
jgi:hypothetical protein